MSGRRHRINNKVIILNITNSDMIEQRKTKQTKIIRIFFVCVASFIHYYVTTQIVCQKWPIRNLQTRFTVLVAII